MVTGLVVDAVSWLRWAGGVPQFLPHGPDGSHVSSWGSITAWWLGCQCACPREKQATPEEPVPHCLESHTTPSPHIVLDSFHLEQITTVGSCSKRRKNKHKLLFPWPFVAPEFIEVRAFHTTVECDILPLSYNPISNST